MDDENSLVGLEIGRKYIIKSKLGSGSFGEIYLCEN